jgi:hypothetical protein
VSVPRDRINIQENDAEKIIQVLNTLNIHKHRFPAAEARRLAQKCEIHTLANQGRWFHMAETTRSSGAR